MSGKITIFVSTLILLMLSGCAVTPPVPQEAPISIQLKGTSTEVQNFIEEKIRQASNGSVYVENATDRVLTLKADCRNMPNQKPMQCGLIMMGIGNSGWSGPFLISNFRTNQIRDVVNVTFQSEWCATNAFGKSNCTSADTNNEKNRILRMIRDAYENEVRR
jgi:hypothetical protein